MDIKSCIFRSLILTSFSCFCQKYYRIEDNVTTGILETYGLENVLQCVRLCERNGTCNAVVFDNINKECTLLTSLNSLWNYQGNNTYSGTEQGVYLYRKACNEGWVEILASCYLFPSTVRDTWYKAKDYCDSQQSHLAVINSEEEQTAIVTWLSNTTNVALWIGGYYNSTTQAWSWINEDTWDYTNFEAGLINALADQGLVIQHAISNPNREWGYGVLSHSRYFLCELEIF